MSNRGVFQIDWKVWDKIGRPGLHSIHDALLLPDAYRVTSFEERKLSPTSMVVRVYVESDRIPDGFIIADLKPIYGREGEQPFFDHMEVAEGKGWGRLPQE